MGLPDSSEHWFYEVVVFVCTYVRILMDIPPHLAVVLMCVVCLFFFLCFIRMQVFITSGVAVGVDCLMHIICDPGGQLCNIWVMLCNIWVMLCNIWVMFDRS